MECFWCPKRNPYFFRAKEDQTQLQEFFVIASLMQPFQSCLAELHHLFSKSRYVTIKHVVRSHFICCLVNTLPGLLEDPEHEARQQAQIRCWRQQQVETPWCDGGKPPRLILKSEFSMKAQAPFFIPVLLAVMPNLILETPVIQCAQTGFGLFIIRSMANFCPSQ